MNAHGEISMAVFSLLFVYSVCFVVSVLDESPDSSCLSIGQACPQDSDGGNELEHDDGRGRPSHDICRMAALDRRVFAV